jgi:peptidoglycan L-alanyl-D-glutamate endopeptidase CwlK
MTYKLSPASLERLKGVHPDLVHIVHKAMEAQVMDFSVSEGLRSEDRQQQLVAQGVSKTLNSKHLKQPDGFGHAVDLYPHPIDMKRVEKGDVREIARFGVLSGVMRTIAHQSKILIVNGMDWDGDGENLDHSFFDAPHFQLVTK